MSKEQMKQKQKMLISNDYLSELSGQKVSCIEIKIIRIIFIIVSWWLTGRTYGISFLKGYYIILPLQRMMCH